MILLESSIFIETVGREWLVGYNISLVGHDEHFYRYYIKYLSVSQVVQVLFLMKCLYTIVCGNVCMPSQCQMYFKAQGGKF